MAVYPSPSGCAYESGLLTGREVEVLSLVLEGKSSKEVASHLFLSKRTIDSHLAKIYDKLNVSNRVQAMRRARELGLLSDSHPVV